MRQGFIMVKDKEKEVVMEICRRLLSKEVKIKKLKKDELIVRTVTLKGGWFLVLVKDAFKTYSDFDGFLYSIANKTSEDEGVIVLGHTDDKGLFWADYPQKPFSEELSEFSNETQICEKFKSFTEEYINEKLSLIKEIRNTQDSELCDLEGLRNIDHIVRLNNIEDYLIYLKKKIASGSFRQDEKT